MRDKVSQSWQAYLHEPEQKPEGNLPGSWGHTPLGFSTVRGASLEGIWNALGLATGMLIATSASECAHWA